MNKKTITTIGIYLILFITNGLFAANESSNYWYGGYTYIDGNPNLSYKIWAWDDTKKQWRFLNDESPIPTNRAFNIRDSLGSTQNCPYMWWGGDPDTATKILLVPQIAYGSIIGKESQQFQNELTAGSYAPYVVICRTEHSISVYIVGPVFKTPDGSNFISRKLTFNFSLFEQLWLKQNWYKSLLIKCSPASLLGVSGDKSTGQIFAFSFKVDGFLEKSEERNAYFLNSPDEQYISYTNARKNVTLSDSAFYISNVCGNNPLGWSWTYQGPENTTVRGMTVNKLQEQGIITYQSAVLPDELQKIINWINSTGKGKFDNIL